MTDIKKFPSGGKWEDIFGYSRTIKAGNRIIITGTTAIDNDGKVRIPGDSYEQTKFIFEKIEGYLKQAGAELEDVVWNRMFITDITKWEGVAKAHSEIFGKIKPCATMVEIKGLIHPDMLIEIETEAITDSSD